MHLIYELANPTLHVLRILNLLQGKINHHKTYFKVDYVM